MPQQDDEERNSQRENVDFVRVRLFFPPAMGDEIVVWIKRRTDRWVDRHIGRQIGRQTDRKTDR